MLTRVQTVADHTRSMRPDVYHSVAMQVCKEDMIDFKEPIVKAEPEICSPRVGGEMRKGGQLSSEEPMSLTVRYNCHAPGETIITMRIGTNYIRIPPCLIAPAVRGRV